MSRKNSTDKSNKNYNKKAFELLKDPKSSYFSDEYMKILDYEEDQLFNAFVLELHLRLDDFKKEFDYCYEKLNKIKNDNLEFNNTSECYKTLKTEKHKFFDKYNYYVDDILTYIALEIAKKNELKFITNKTYGYSKSQHDRFTSLFLEDDKFYSLIIDEHLNLYESIKNFFNEHAALEYNQNTPTNFKYRKRNVDVKISLHLSKKEQKLELERLKKFIDSNKIVDKELTESQKLILDIEKFVFDQKQEGIASSLFYFDKHSDINISILQKKFLDLINPKELSENIILTENKAITKEYEYSLSQSPRTINKNIKFITKLLNILK